MLALRVAVAALCRKYGIRVVTEESPVGQHPSDGRAEQAVRAKVGQVRVLLAALEGRLGVKIPLDLPIFSWIIQY